MKEDTRESRAVDIIFSLNSGYLKSSEDTNDPPVYSTLNAYLSYKKNFFLRFLTIFISKTHINNKKIFIYRYLKIKMSNRIAEEMTL